MKQNVLYVNTNQDDAVKKSSELTNDDRKYDAYQAWRGLSDYASDDRQDRAIEGNVVECMQEIRDSYRNYSENLEWNYPAARPFCEQKDFIEQSILFKIFQDMPKCSLLHIHDAAGLSIEKLIALLERWPVTADVPELCIVSKQGGKRKVGTLYYKKDGEEMEPFSENLKDFFRKQDSKIVLKNLLSFSSSARTEGIPYIWDEFNNIFARTGELFSNSLFYYYYHLEMFLEMIEDRIEYAEIRCSFTDFTDKPIPGGFVPWNLIDKDIPFLETMKQSASDALTKWNQEHVDDQREFNFKVILCARRDLDILDKISDREGYQNQGDKILLKMDSAIVMKQNPKYAEMIVGFDLVSEEDRGKRTYTLFSRGIYENVGTAYKDAYNRAQCEDMLEFNPDLAKLRIQMIDLYLHDGESTWAENDNMLDAVIMARHRIGHGFNLSKFPALIDQIIPKGGRKSVEAKEPFLEICPISNQMLRYFTDLRTHSAYELLKSGIQCVLGNDDPTILGNPGLSYDFWEAYVGMGLTMNEIKCLVFNAYVCETLAKGGYPCGDDGQYILNEAAMIQTFNQTYWMPFLRRAYNRLNENGLLPAQDN